jgi:hypothetical protein
MTKKSDRMTSASSVTVGIRRGAAGDAAAISAVLRAAFGPYEAFYTPAGFAATTPDEEEVRARMAEGFMWVAADGSGGACSPTRRPPHGLVAKPNRAEYYAVSYKCH